MSTTMRRVKLTAPERLVVEQVPVPRPAEGEALLEIAWCGICGSDLHASVGKHPFIPLPATPGHEISARVSAVGPGVTGWKPGDRVTVEPNLVCGQCYNCRTGRYNICTGTRELLGDAGKPGLRVVGCQAAGGMADYLVVPAAKLVAIPDGLGLKHAVLVEPLAVGAHAAHRGGDLYGKNAAIVGSGTIGLAVLASVLAAGAARVWVLDPARDRLAAAREVGAHRTLAGTADDIATVRREAGATGIDVAFECVGVGPALRSSMALVRKGGRVVVIGVYGEEATIRAADLQDQELELIGSLMYTMRDVEEAVRLLASGRVPADRLIGAVFPLDQAAEAFASARSRTDVIKTVIAVRPE
jgi:L-iditol 2-dehydrogenase